MLKKIWHPQHKFSYKLQILIVRTCPRLANLIPSHLIHNFQNLKELDVSNCEVLEYVFDHQGLNRDDEILPKIEILKLQLLPKLRLTFYEDKNDNMFLEHIKQLCIINCGKPLDEKVSFLSYFFCSYLCHLKYLETFTIKIYIFFKKKV